MAYWRNEELHTAESPFRKLKESEWMPRFYDACQYLCKRLERTLEDLVGAEHAEAAALLIEGSQKERITAVKSAISSHAKVFQSKPADEQSALIAASEKLQLTELVGASSGHAISLQRCPACAAQARVMGQRIREAEPVLVDGDLVVSQLYFATEARCLACGLRLASPAELHIANLQPRFSRNMSLDPSSIFSLESDEEPYMDM